jgi:CoA:oxalate CoA-transferase
MLMTRLLESADVFVTNLRAATLERLGFGTEALRKRFPRLIVVCISGFDLKNSEEYADRAGLAIVAEACPDRSG